MPNSRPADGLEISRLQSILNAAKCLMVITGAGVSTESGIPGKKWCLFCYQSRCRSPPNPPIGGLHKGERVPYGSERPGVSVKGPQRSDIHV